MPTFFSTILEIAILTILFIGLNTMAGGYRILKRDHPENEGYIRIYKGIEIISLLVAVLIFSLIVLFSSQFFGYR